MPSAQKLLFLRIQARQAVLNHARGAHRELHADRRFSSPQNQAVVAEASPARGVQRERYEDRTRLGMRSPEGRKHHWLVSHPMLFQFRQVVLVIGNLPTKHCITAIITRAGSVWAHYSYVQRRQTARKGRRRKDIGGAERWTGGDETKSFSFRAGICEVRKRQDRVPHAIVSPSGLGTGTQEGVRATAAEWCSASRTES